MPLRNSPSQIRDLDDLSQLSNIVSDKRRGQRSLGENLPSSQSYID
jgi:hypothetical protein